LRIGHEQNRDLAHFGSKEALQIDGSSCQRGAVLGIPGTGHGPTGLRHSRAEVLVRALAESGGRRTV
jgi:hypothetical protein